LCRGPLGLPEQRAAQAFRAVRLAPSQIGLEREVIGLA
jgi:hypothetical protein